MANNLSHSLKSMIMQAIKLCSLGFILVAFYRPALSNECTVSFDIDETKTLTQFNWKLDGGSLYKSMTCPYASQVYENMIFGNQGYFSPELYESYDKYIQRLRELNDESSEALTTLIDSIGDQPWELLKQDFKEKSLSRAAFLVSAVGCIRVPSKFCIVALALASNGALTTTFDSDGDKWTDEQVALKDELNRLSRESLLEKLALPEKYKSEKARYSQAITSMCADIKQQCLKD